MFTVDIAKDLIQLRKREKEKRKIEWEKIRIERMENKNRYYGDGIFDKAILNDNGDKKIMLKSNDMKNELRYLNQNECEIIIKLRTERINLNGYLYFINKNDTNECKHCSSKENKVIETVNHYLMDCSGYKSEVIRLLYKHNMDFNVVRNKLKNKLRKIDIFFKNPRNFNTINILFPHTWQRRIVSYQRDNYMKTEWRKIRLKKRVAILKAVVEFVRETKRFKTDNGL